LGFADVDLYAADYQVHSVTGSDSDTGSSAFFPDVWGTLI